MDLMSELAARAHTKFPRVVFPDADDPIVQQAARIVLDRHIARPTLVGRSADVSKSGIDLRGMEIVEPTSCPRLGEYAKRHAARAGIAEAVALRLLSRPLNFAAMMLGTGDAEGMVAGFGCDTGAVIVASQMFVGMADRTHTASSFFVMDVPDWDGGEKGRVVFADCAVAQNPSAEELAEIAITTASNVRSLLDWEPRVALLSFSTRGSSAHPDVEKVVQALGIVKDRAPDLCIDGELQADAALVPSVAKKKIAGDSRVAGRANILVFPDLDAGNIAYKLVQRLAKAAAYGPVLQGFKKPASDLSRGASVEDIVGAVTIVAARA